MFLCVESFKKEVFARGCIEMALMQRASTGAYVCRAKQACIEVGIPKTNVDLAFRLPWTSNARAISGKGEAL